MKIEFSRRFRKDILKLNSKELKQFKSRLDLFQRAPTHPKLRNHQLKGKLRGFASINITGDIRAIYTIKKQAVRFVRLGTHSELY